MENECNMQNTLRKDYTFSFILFHIFQGDYNKNES